jgi:hypothetical protein
MEPQSSLPYSQDYTNLPTPSQMNPAHGLKPYLRSVSKLQHPLSSHAHELQGFFVLRIRTTTALQTSFAHACCMLHPLHPP